MKRVRSISELLCFLLLPLIFLLCIAIFLILGETKETIHLIYYYIYILQRFLVLLMVLMMSILIPINKFTISKGLPVDCLYNPFGVIEIHVGRKCKGSQTIFIKTCLEVILLGIEENKDILFDSWIIPRTKMIKIFGNAVEFPPIGFCQRLNNIYSKIYYRENLKKESYRCIIHVNDISTEQQKILREKLIRLEKRITAKG